MGCLGKVISSWIEKLSDVLLPLIIRTSAINQPFFHSCGMHMLRYYAFFDKLLFKHLGLLVTVYVGCLEHPNLLPNYLFLNFSGRREESQENIQLKYWPFQSYCKWQHAQFKCFFQSKKVSCKWVLHRWIFRLSKQWFFVSTWGSSCITFTCGSCT